MASFDVLLPEVLPEVPGVSVPLALREIRRAASELCERAFVLKREVTGVRVQALEPRVVLASIEERQIVHLQNVTLDGRRVDKASQDHLDVLWGAQDGQPAYGDHWRVYRQERPERYYLEREGEDLCLRLVGIPLRDFDTLAYTAILAPSAFATELDTWLLDRYASTIASGAIAGLLKIPKKEWTDPATAAVYRAEFDDGIGQARGDGARDFTRNDETTGRTTAYV